jgi:hypothetical protein
MELSKEAIEAARVYLSRRGWDLPKHDKKSVRQFGEAIEVAAKYDADKRYSEEIASGARAPNGRLWSEHVRLASEPEGPSTGLHRDSMG